MKEESRATTGGRKEEFNNEDEYTYLQYFSTEQ